MNATPSNSTTHAEVNSKHGLRLAPGTVADISSVALSVKDQCPSGILTGKDLAALAEARVAFLTHYIPLYQVRVFQEWARAVGSLKIFLSTPIEPNRDFQLDWSGLDVLVQSSVTMRRRWRHRHAGFEDPLFVHIPYDTGRRLRRMQPDVVVSHELGARSFCAARYCKRSGAKLVLATFMSEHTEQGRGGLRHRLRRYLINQADALTYNGPSCRRYLLSLGAREEQLFHWPYAADDRHFQGAGFQQTASVPALPPRNRLLCIGQLTQRKGVMPMLRQINRFIQSTGRAIELTLVGNGPLRDELNNLSQHESTRSFPQSLDANFRLNVLGNRPAESLPALMRQHGALIAPTLADEWLLVVNEAMHIGLPVIGSVYAQAVTTLIDHGRNGWQYDPLIDSEVNAKVAGAPPLDRVLREFLELDDLGYGDLQAEARTTVAHLTPHYSAAGIGAAIAATLQTRLRSDR